MFRKNVIEKVRGRKPASKELTQLFLTVEELDTDVITVLTTCNPYFLEDAVEFCYREGTYKQLQNRRSSILFFSQRGNIKRKEEIQITHGSEKAKESVEELDTKRKNKFNFCDRATQTVNFLQKERGNQTEPSSQLQFDGTVSAAEIVLAYQEREAGEMRDRGEKLIDVSRKSGRKGDKTLMFAHHLKFLRFCERMVDQNLMSDVNIDYSFYDTPSDEFKDKGLGSLLALWRFNYQPMRGMAVTCLSWNSLYSDMFAAAFGLYDVAMRHRPGCVCVFSLKCPSHPEKVLSCKSGVCCVEFSPYWPHLLAVGLADGSVAVHDVRRAGDSPVAINKNSRLEHNDAVNQVKWLPDNIDGQPNFCSISADCKVINWILAKSELIPSEVLNLKENEVLTEESAEKRNNFTSCGTSISFNPESNDLFLIGNENGLIQKFSNLSTAQYLEAYTDHNNVVYNVQWNPHHPRIFLSCSADWTIRIWDHSLKDSVFTFDLLNEVKDVTWAPFSSSLFAAVTNDGKVHVFDTLLNRQQPTASYTVSSSKKIVNLTSVQFNPMKPVIIIGDDRGTVISFKLSPNLRSSLKVFQTTETSKFSALELEKMEKVLKLARIQEHDETVTSE